jgi:hypothetical protein
LLIFVKIFLGFGRYEGLGVGRREEKIGCICEDGVVQIISLKCSERKKWREELYVVNGSACI